MFDGVPQSSSMEGIGLGSGGWLAVDCLRIVLGVFSSTFYTRSWLHVLVSVHFLEK